MPKILPQNRADWSETAPPVGEYNVIITGYKVDRNGMPRFYYDIIDGPYEGVYQGIEGFYNSFLLSNRDYSMLTTRLENIQASNENR